MAFQFFKRDFPDLDSDHFEMRASRRVAVMLFVFTHGLWLITSTIALLFAVTEALPANDQMLLVAQILE
jgi:hypothetical protein